MIMKKYVSLFAALLICVASWAQKDVTTFLGIPVDGYKNEMKQKLIQKGFTYDSTFDMLEGEFNGHPVSIKIVTNNNKVYRILLVDQNAASETDIKIRFNTLCQQFENNKRYFAPFKSQSIPEDEDISYQMTVNNKRYQASYLQLSNKELLDTAAIRSKAYETISKKYTAEQLLNPSEEIVTEFTDAYNKIINDYTWDIVQNKSVWFMINEHLGEYRIIMYYDTKYNEANGEDL